MLTVDKCRAISLRMSSLVHLKIPACKCLVSSSNKTSPSRRVKCIAFVYHVELLNLIMIGVFGELLL